MDSEFVAILQKLIAEQGKETLFKTAKCKALLADYTRGDYKRESRLLLQALDAGVQKAIDKAENITVCKKQQIRLLHEEYSLDEKLAAEVVDTLALVLRGDDPKSNIEALIERGREHYNNNNYNDANKLFKECVIKEKLTRSIGLLSVRHDGIKIISTIMFKGTELPAHEEREFSTNCANQTIIYLQAYEYTSLEEEIIFEEWKPGIKRLFDSCEVKLTSGLPEGAPIKLIFDVGYTGLNITAMDLTNNIPLTVDIKCSWMK